MGSFPQLHHTMGLHFSGHAMPLEQVTVNRFFEEALTFHRQGDLGKAHFYYSKVLAEDESHHISQHHLSVIKFELGDYDAALKLQNALINTHPAKAGYFNNRGNTYLRLGELERAIQDFDQAIALEFQTAEFHVNRANTWATMHRLDEALADLNQAIALSPDLTMAFANRANLFIDTSRLPEALSDINQALKLEPANVQFHCFKAHILAKLKRYQDAQAQYRLTCEMDPSFELAHLKWADLMVRMHEYPQAVEVLRTANLHHPQSSTCLLLLAEVHAVLGETNLAAAYFAQARQLNPKDELVDFHAAANLGLPPPAQAPIRYVVNLFDSYAHHFEMELQQDLAYDSPSHLLAQLRRHASTPFSSALDLGCGTGLVAQTFKACCADIDGLDVSVQMLQKAKATQLYRHLHHEEAHAFFLQRHRQSYDLVVSADMLIYIGQLDALFEGVAQILNAKGWFSFTIEATSAPMYALKQSKRYGHAVRYVEDQARQAGLELVAVEGDIIRLEQPQAVRGFNVLLRKM